MHNNATYTALYCIIFLNPRNYSIVFVIMFGNKNVYLYDSSKSNRVSSEM